MVNNIVILPPGALLDRIGQPVNPFLCVVVEQHGPDLARTRFLVSEWRETPAPRSLEAVEYIADLAGRLARQERLPTMARSSRDILFQAEDNPADAPGVTWQTRANWSWVRLVPDLYYYQRYGYRDYLVDVPTWEARRSKLIWRGSATGIVQLTEPALGGLARYRLCREALRLGDLADVKLIGIVQAASDEQHQLLTERVEAEGLAGDFVPMERMAEYKYVVDIDGNASAWNFMAKLRLGCCVFRVDSEWRQWFSDALVPWEHYVPIAADLSDLAAKLDWCLKHDGEAQRIAARGRRFALDMDYEREMDDAARAVFCDQEVLC